MLSGMRRFALITLLVFGCATVRTPVAPLGEPTDAPGTVAPPGLELWLESPDPVPAAQREQAERQARAALDTAMQTHEIPRTAMGASDAVLFVRERAVGVTEERRSQQNWAKVGIVVGIAVVVAVVVIAVVSGRGKDLPTGKSAVPKSALPVRAASVPVKSLAGATRAAPIRTAIAPAAAVAPAIGHVTTPLPRYYQPAGGRLPIFIGFSFNFWIPPRPVVLLPEDPSDDLMFPPDVPVPLADEPPPPDREDAPLMVASADGPPRPEPEPPALSLPPLADEANFSVHNRGFFAGPHTALQVDLVDRATGQVLWSRAVAGDADPMDAGDMKHLLDEALGGERWSRREPR